MPDALDWSPPAELAGPTPRQCTYPLLDYVTSGLQALAFVVFLSLPISGYLAARDLAALKAQGVPVQGLVTDLSSVTHNGSSRITSGGSSTSHGIEYQYAAGGADGSAATYKRSTGIGTDDYAGLRVGGPVPVIYDRAAPEHSALGFETAPFPGHEKVMALELFFCGMALIFGFGLWLRMALYRRQKKLLRWGQPARACITGTKMRETQKAVYLSLRYTFTDAGGQTIDAAEECVRLKKSGPAEVPTTVLFDPKNSAIRALYPLSHMSIAN